MEGNPSRCHQRRLSKENDEPNEGERAMCDGQFG
jgi:hypothetical protein